MLLNVLIDNFFFHDWMLIARYQTRDKGKATNLIFVLQFFTTERMCTSGLHRVPPLEGIQITHTIRIRGQYPKEYQEFFPKVTFGLQFGYIYTINVNI